MTINSFRDLRVWQAGMDLVVEVYRVTEGFPSRERFGLASQMERAAVSVPSNIAEGHTRAYTRDYLHYVAVAHASVAELQTQVEIAARLGYLSQPDCQRLSEDADALSRQLNKLRVALSAKLDPKSSIPAPRSH
jgi:four helix bundle protein